MVALAKTGAPAKPARLFWSASQASASKTGAPAKPARLFWSASQASASKTGAPAKPARPFWSASQASALVRLDSAGMAIADVLTFRVVTVGPNDPVRLAIARMLEESIGSVAVCEGERLVGIFTERDVLRLAGEGSDFAEIRIGDVMTRNPVTLRPDDDVLEAARLMGERKIRHVPVLEGENLLGMVGIREVMRTLVERLWRSQDSEAHERARELLGRSSSTLPRTPEGV